MSDTDQTGADDLYRARLYAAGELDELAAAAFELRLADDQSARDALCAAVRARATAAGRTDPAPDARYRERVRKRILKTTRWRRIAGRLGDRVPTPAWVLAGTVAAALLLVSFRSGFRRGEKPAMPPSFETNKSTAPATAEREAPETLEDWPELVTGQHLARAVDEENRRKVRAEDRRMVRMEDWAARLHGARDYKQ